MAKKYVFPDLWKLTVFVLIQSATLSHVSGHQAVTIPNTNAAGKAISSPRSSDPVFNADHTSSSDSVP